MNAELIAALPRFLDILGLDEAPMGIFYTDEPPADCFSPQPLDTPTREKEMRNEIDWGTIFKNFSCVMGNIWRARKKKKAACFDARHFGCPGAAFWLGFIKPQTETIIYYVSSGIRDYMQGELYCESPDELRHIFESIDPRPAPKKFCVVKPLNNFNAAEMPELIVFFTRPESLCGIHQLAMFVTNDPEVVRSPWGPGCGNIITWPLKYLERGENKAVLGGWDPSARKFFKTDELSFTIPYPMFEQMIMRYERSFLTTQTWATVRKKIERSKRAWNEGEKGSSDVV